MKTTTGWRTSSHCLNEANCVEVNVPWRTSSYSTSPPHNDCVEVSPGAATVAVRDTKDRTRGHFSVAPAAWEAFLSAVPGL